MRPIPMFAQWIGSTQGSISRTRDLDRSQSGLSVWWLEPVLQSSDQTDATPPSVAGGHCVRKILQEAIQVQQEWSGERCVYDATAWADRCVWTVLMWAGFPLRCSFFFVCLFLISRIMTLFRPTDVYRQLDCTDSSHFKGFALCARLVAQNNVKLDPNRRRSGRLAFSDTLEKLYHTK